MTVPLELPVGAGALAVVEVVVVELLLELPQPAMRIAIAQTAVAIKAVTGFACILAAFRWRVHRASGLTGDSAIGLWSYDHANERGPPLRTAL